jgi:hypothetical protein
MTRRWMRALWGGGVILLVVGMVVIVFRLPSSATRAARINRPSIPPPPPCAPPSPSSVKACYGTYATATTLTRGQAHRGQNPSSGTLPVPPQCLPAGIECQVYPIRRGTPRTAPPGIPCPRRVGGGRMALGPGSEGTGKAPSHGYTERSEQKLEAGGGAGRSVSHDHITQRRTRGRPLIILKKRSFEPGCGAISLLLILEEYLQMPLLLAW